MPCYVCEKCGAIENTALGHYWSRRVMKYEDESLNGKALCSECAPLKYASGEDTGYNGKWHGKFEKEIFDPEKHAGWDLMNVHNGKVIPTTPYREMSNSARKQSNKNKKNRKNRGKHRGPAW